MKKLYVIGYMSYVIRQVCVCAIMTFLFSLQLFADLPAGPALSAGRQAGENQSLITDANQSYSDGDFQEAVEWYEQVLANGYEAPQLYYNLGNSYFKSNNLPAAILNYERAKRLAPNDEDITFNLKLANLKTLDKTEPIPPLFFKVCWNNFDCETREND